MITRLASLLLGFNLVLAGWTTLAAEPAAAGPRPPNLVVFLADDAGWGDYGVHGNPDVRTPHIDSLARDGVSLTWFFVQPVCAPTRAEFLTGRYHPRSGVRGVSTGQERMDLGERTLAEGFQAAGYATGAFGKWHNGSQWPYHPQARGFGEYLGHTSGHWGEYVDPPLERNGRMERTQGYIVDVCTDAALEFIGRHRDRPFLCYVPFTTPHSPWSVPDEYWRRFRDRPISRRASVPGQEDVDQTRCALAMMENQDDNVGRILSRLDELGLRENTIVVYFSDNGPNTWRWNGGMKGRKGGTDDGSVRSPCFIRWPAGLPAGRAVPQIAGAIDLLPTLTALAGVPRAGDRPLDGRDLSPLLRGETVDWPDRLIFSHWAGRVSVRSDRHRLDAAGHLYDLVADPSQTRNVTAAQSETARRLQEAVAAWRAEMFGEGWQAVPGGAVDPRPIPVGHPEFPITMLPARDGEPRGGVRRSASAPNSSYFTHWTSPEDRMVWNLEVRTAGEYEVVIDYTCPLEDAGSRVAVDFGKARLIGQIAPGWDPPLYTHQDTLPRPPGESRLKEFRSLPLGRVRLEAGRGALTLSALEIPGRTVADVRRVTLTLWDSPVTFPERGALPALFPPDVKTERYDPGEPDYFLFGSPERSLEQIRKIQAAMPPGRFTSPSNDWRHLTRTRRVLTEGGRLKIMAIGDSIVNDTLRSGWVALLREAYPQAEITATVYVRGGGGAQHFREDQRLEKQVFPRRPDLVFLGGISQRSIEDLEVLIDRLRAGLPEVEILLGTGAFGTVDPRDPAALAAAAHSGTGGYGRRLRALADRTGCAFLDFTTPWAEYLHASGQHPHRFHRDAVHANEFGEQILAKIVMAFWGAPEVRAATGAATPFVAPTGARVAEPIVRPFGDAFPNLDSLAVGEWWTRRPTGPNPPPSMDVPRDQVVAFALYTQDAGVLKLTAQLYPLRPDETRVVRLEFLREGGWVEAARSDVVFPGWSAHFRMAGWDASRDVPYRVRHGDRAMFEGRIRRDPTDKEVIVVANLSCNSSRTTGLRPEILDTLKAQDPDLLFFGGDQTYRHTEHTAGWIEFGLQFRDVLRDRPTICIPDDHDVGHPNLWGENGRQSRRQDGADGGYFYPVDYVNMVQRQQTWHLPDAPDPAPVERGITVYFTRLRVGGVDCAILEDRKFKSGPAGKIPRMGPRPDHINDPSYDPRTVDVPGLQLLGDRQERFLRAWGQDWVGARMKAVLSQTAFCGAVHMHGGRNDRLLADLDCNGWPQTPRNRALEELRRALAVHLCGDQHLAVVVKHGIDGFRDGPYGFTSPALVNTIYGRWWHPADEQPGPNAVPGSPLPWTGDFRDGLDNRFTMLAYANPPNITDERQRADGYGLVRFHKPSRRITFECWPRFAEVKAGDSAQFPGWPITVSMEENDGRKPVAWLPELVFVGVSDPVVQVVRESDGDLLYTLRVAGDRFQPAVYAPGTYTVRIGRDRPDGPVLGGLMAGPRDSVGSRRVVF